MTAYEMAIWSITNNRKSMAENQAENGNDNETAINERKSLMKTQYWILGDGEHLGAAAKGVLGVTLCGVWRAA
jgi:hypothetical protein